MSILNSLDTGNDVKGQEDDRLGGGFLLDSAVYDMTIKVAYLGQSQHGANFVHIECENPDGDKIRQDIYFTNRQGDNFYIRDGEKNYLPGYNQLNALSLLACGKGLTTVDTEEKVVNVYDFDQGKEVPVPKEVLMDWVNQPITLGILRILDDKSVKNADDKYVPTGETREYNEIDKVFRTDNRLTVTEMKAEATEPKFINEWDDKWKGEVKTAKGFTGKRDPSLGDAPAAGQAGAPKPTPSSLFTE